MSTAEQNTRSESPLDMLPPLAQKINSLTVDVLPRYFDRETVTQTLREIAELGGNPEEEYQFATALAEETSGGKTGFQYPAFEELMESLPSQSPATAP